MTYFPCPPHVGGLEKRVHDFEHASTVKLYFCHSCTLLSVGYSFENLCTEYWLKFFKLKVEINRQPK